MAKAPNTNQQVDPAPRIPRAMTTAQVMEALNVQDRDTIYELVKSGRLPAVQLGREYRFDPEVVAAFLRNENAVKLDAQKRAAERRRAGPPRVPPDWMNVEPVIKRRGRPRSDGALMRIVS
jgi:excisionase family DNA binding protein